VKKVVPRKVVSRVDCEDRDFAAVFNVIAQRRARALMSVNVEMLLTNWEVGAFLSQRVHTGSWSTAVVGRLADYIKRNDPTLKGYGKSNLYNMALVYDTFSSEAFLELAGRYAHLLNVPADIFQPVVGKCLPPSRKQLIPKEVLERTFEEYLALPERIPTTEDGSHSSGR